MFDAFRCPGDRAEDGGQGNAFPNWCQKLSYGTATGKHFDSLIRGTRKIHCNILKFPIARGDQRERRPDPLPPRLRALRGRGAVEEERKEFEQKKPVIQRSLVFFAGFDIFDIFDLGKGLSLRIFL